MTFFNEYDAVISLCQGAFGLAVTPMLPSPLRIKTG